jgi:phosphatidylinositol glycan class A protein
VLLDELSLILQRWQVLNQGQIYLCTSLTEAFGISIIEAASAGLFIVSTKVGGVPEVLPKDMIEFVSPNSSGKAPRFQLRNRSRIAWLTGCCTDVVRALSIAVETIKSGIHDPLLAHQRLQGMYTWSNVAERTERVYDKAMTRPERDLFERMSR